MNKRLPVIELRDLVRTALVCLSVFSMSEGVAGETAKTVTKRYSVGGAGQIQLSLRADWQENGKPTKNPNFPMVIQLASGNRNDFAISIHPSTPEKNSADSGDLKSAVERLAKPYAKGSGENKIELQRFKGAESEGYFFSITDNTYNAGRPGDFKYLARGLAKVGGLFVSFSVLSNDPVRKTAEEACVEMLRQATHIKP